jgi:predicted nucleic acid-binding protein
VRIVVDSNIVLSVLLNSSSTIGELLFNSHERYTFFAPNYLQEEIEEHWKKLLKISKLNEEELRDAQFRVYKRIHFFDEHEIPEKIWKSCEEILKDIDPDDIPFLVLTKHLRAILWSGDRTLVLGLRKKGFTKIITTSELRSIVE